MRDLLHAVSFRHLQIIPRAATLVAALFVFAGCSTIESSDDTLSASPVESTAPGVDERAAAAEAAVSAALQAWRDGDSLAAMAIATRALRDGVPDEYEPRLRRIRTQARETLLEEQVARLSVMAEQDAIADGDDVRGVVRVQNRSSAPVVIARTADDSSATLAVLEIVRHDYDPWGNVRSNEFTQRVTLTDDLELGPGGLADIPFTIPADSIRLNHVGFSTLRIGGHLRAVSVKVGATELFDALPIEPALVRVFQQNYEPMAENPMESLRLAIAKRSPPHILIAAELLAPDERAEAVDLLAVAAEEDPPLAPACNAASQRLKALLSGDAE
jgi:hypothetical protein